MTLLAICQTVCQECGFDEPTSIVANTDQDARYLFALANRAGKELARYHWQELETDGAITTVNGQPNYALPSDYYSIINDTLWDTANFWQLRGSITPQDWRAYQSGLVQTSVRRKLRIMGSQILVFPTPSVTGESLTFEYRSRNWITDPALVGVYYDSFVGDSHEPRFDSDLLTLSLIWRFLERKGFAYSEAKNDFENERDRRLGTQVPHSILNLGTSGYDEVPPLPILPITGYG